MGEGRAQRHRSWGCRPSRSGWGALRVIPSALGSKPEHRGERGAVGSGSGAWILLHPPGSLRPQERACRHERLPVCPLCVRAQGQEGRCS